MDTVVDKNPILNANHHMVRRILTLKDIEHFKNSSPGYKNVIHFVNLLAEHISGTGSTILNDKYELKNQVFIQCKDYIDQLSVACEATDLNVSQESSSPRFGHLAFRNWFDVMELKTEEFVNSIVKDKTTTSEDYKMELKIYLYESFGNRTRIDYGTGHELNFFIFLMGLAIALNDAGNEGDSVANRDVLNEYQLLNYVKNHGWDILALMMHSYIKLCRQIQIKFRLEPAGSRGVYNVDDFQYLPFLFGAAQLVRSGAPIYAFNFYLKDTVDAYKNEYIFIEAVDHILNTKRGPFNEHSFTLWEFSDHRNWDSILRRLKGKFVDEVLKPFPIIQHLYFGKYILTWE